MKFPTSARATIEIDPDANQVEICAPWPVQPDSTPGGYALELGRKPTSAAAPDGGAAKAWRMGMVWKSDAGAVRETGQKTAGSRQINRQRVLYVCYGNG